MTSAAVESGAGGGRGSLGPEPRDQRDHGAGCGGAGGPGRLEPRWRGRGGGLARVLRGSCALTLRFPRSATSARSRPRVSAAPRGVARPGSPPRDARARRKWQRGGGGVCAPRRAGLGSGSPLCALPYMGRKPRAFPRGGRRRRRASFPAQPGRRVGRRAGPGSPAAPGRPSPSLPQFPPRGPGRREARPLLHADGHGGAGRHPALPGAAPQTPRELARGAGGGSRLHPGQVPAAPCRIGFLPRRHREPDPGRK